MKKIITIFAVCIATAAFAFPAFAASQDWDQFVASMQQRENIKTTGPQILAQVSAQAPAVSDKELWKLSCSAPTAEQQAAASVALVNRWFPNGDPSQWEKVNGFFPPSSYTPLQIVAVNALFNAVTALSQIPDGKYAAAYLMNTFSQSALGMITFIETMPAPFRKTLDSLIAETGMQPEKWASTTIEGPYPFVPVYNWYTTYSNAVSNNFQFLNGWGGIAGSGPYAWDRVHGYIYQIMESGDNNFWLNN